MFTELGVEKSFSFEMSALETTSDNGAAKSPQRLAGVRRHVRKVLGFVLQQWLIIGFAIACVLGYLFPCK